MVNGTPPVHSQHPRPPHYFWAVGLLSLLWNVLGAYISFSAQSGSLSALRAEDEAIFASQPIWLVIGIDIGLLAGIAGAVALLLQHQFAVWLYTTLLLAIVLANAYEVAAGTSRMLTGPAAVVER